MSDNAKNSSSPTSPASFTAELNTAASPEQPQSAKRSRGRPRKYHTDAEREEAKRRYRENHRTKATTGDASILTQSEPAPKQQDIDELWEAIHALQSEVATLKNQLAQKDAAASVPAKRRKA